MTRQALKVVGVLVTVGLCSPALAHQDRIFPIADDGTIHGVDGKFGTVSVVVRRGKGAQATQVTFQTAGKVVRLPPCLAKWFALPEGKKMAATGSWWHERSILPPYLALDLPERNGSSPSAHQILFNLETAEVIQVSAKGKKLPLHRLCSQSELKQLRPTDP